MDILTPQTVPFIFIIISVIFFINYLRHRSRPGNTQAIAQRNRLRMAIIFGLVGVGQLVWRLIQK